MLEKKRVNTGALLGLFGAVAALALVILLENTIGPTGQLIFLLFFFHKSFQKHKP